ncbi:MAG: hypothetical protein HY422_02130 [Candidatus Komeilibacteria bacterium]|nr:hypothetical protein [Candidatus Komeilibacteria bacterium]
MNKFILLLISLLALSACTLPLEVKQIRTDLDTLDRASSTVDQLNGRINELNRQIEQ